MFHSVAELVRLAEEKQCKISRAMLEREVALRQVLFQVFCSPSRRS
ncbi:hypothetical protein [Paenibacillus sp. NAIST15-1]|nr:hypothetical protein [Paenibacillus sp. NAIST15-1]